MNTNGLLGVELRHLVALDAIAKHSSFSSAAAELGYTQSAVSQQIAALERSVGQRLLERGGGSRTVELTDAGRLVLRHARSISSRLSALEADLRTLHDARTVRVGVFQSVGDRIVPLMMAGLAETHPEIELELLEDPSCDPLELKAAEGALELAFTILPVEDLRLEARSLLMDDHLLVVPRDDPRAALAPDLELLGSLPMVCYRDCRGQTQVEERMAAAGAPVTVVRRADGNGIIQGLVATGAGAALLPRLAYDPKDERLVAIELDGLVPPREIGLVWQRDRQLSDAAKAVIEAAATVCGALRAPVAR